MGAWGVGSFDNDAACDWAYELEHSGDLRVITQSVNAVFTDEFIDADLGAEAIAAIDVMARLRGRPMLKNSYTEVVDNWVDNHPLTLPQSLIDSAHKALQVLMSDASELRELWIDSDEIDAWLAEVKSLAAKLS